MAIVGEPCNADAHAKIPALFITMLYPRCAHIVCTHVLYNCTLWLWLYSWSIRASHPSRGHNTHMTHTQRQSQMLSAGENSPLLFRLLPSLLYKPLIFSFRHTQHFLVMGLRGGSWSIRLQLMSNSFPSSATSPTYIPSVVLVSLLLCQCCALSISPLKSELFHQCRVSQKRFTTLFA